MNDASEFGNSIQSIANIDVVVLIEKNEEYGSSWKKRGGIGAFMMLARKWDRIENLVSKHGWDIFAAFISDVRDEGLLDDIADLRRYLLLCEDEMLKLREALKYASNRHTVPPIPADTGRSAKS